MKNSSIQTFDANRAAKINFQTRIAKTLILFQQITRELIRTARERERESSLFFKLLTIAMIVTTEGDRFVNSEGSKVIYSHRERRILKIFKSFYFESDRKHYETE